MENNTTLEGCKLEKLLLSDIDRAEAAYIAVRKFKRAPLESDAVRRPPKGVKDLFETNQRARADMERTEKSLEAVGYRIDGYGAKRQLGIGFGVKPKSISSFDEETEKTKGALQELTRTYTLKLFAGGEEAQGLFASLVKELVSIVS